METNELMEKARALLAAATPGEWAQCIEDAHDGCYGISPLNPTSDCGREQAWHDAALIAFAVNNLPALLDALAAEKQRADKAESDAAALPAMDAECARLRAQVDADRQTIVRMTDELAERDALRAEVEQLRPLASAEMERRAIAEMMNGGET